jgi:sugar lactone lactonase YvrE
LEFTPDNFGLIGIPMAIAANSQGELFVTDTELQRVWKVPAEGGEPGEFLLVSGPRGIVVDDEDHVWVLSLQTPQLQRVSPDGEAVAIVSELTFEFPHQVELGPDGTAYVSDGYAKAIWKVTPDGAAEKWISGEPLDNPVGISWHGEELLIIDPRANALFSAAADGTLSQVFPVESE